MSEKLICRTYLGKGVVCLPHTQRNALDLATSSPKRFNIKAGEKSQIQNPLFVYEIDDITPRDTNTIAFAI